MTLPSCSAVIRVCFSVGFTDWVKVLGTKQSGWIVIMDIKSGNAETPQNQGKYFWDTTFDEYNSKSSLRGLPVTGKYSNRSVNICICFNCI